MTTNKPSTRADAQTKPGFFKRIFSKVDSAMKAKADEQSKNSCCCSGDDKGKGGKCC